MNEHSDYLMRQGVRTPYLHTVSSFVAPASGVTDSTSMNEPLDSKSCTNMIASASDVGLSKSLRLRIAIVNRYVLLMAYTIQR
jgi:hypothetical protein